MSKPLVVEIPHELGRDEARRRIERNMEKGKQLLEKSGFTILNLTWTDDRLDFGVSALAQKVEGSLEIGEQAVRVVVQLPLLLALFSEKIKEVLGQQGNLLLTKK